MLHEALRRADGPVALTRIVHLLACEFAIRISSLDLDRCLDRLVPHARQEFPPISRFAWTVSGEAGGFRLDLGSEESLNVASHERAAETLVARMHEHAFGSLAALTKIHAGCVDIDGRRALVVGHGRAGKTTLMTRLAFDRAAVQGDEMVIVRDHSVIAYPRRFGLRRGTLDLIPEASRLAPGRVREPSPHDYQVVSFDPAEQGLDWRIREAPVDDIVLLVRHDNPMSSISPCDRHEMARHVMANSHGPTGDPRQWIRDACAILAGARCSILTMGDLGSGVAMLREAVRAPAHTG